MGEQAISRGSRKLPALSPAAREGIADWILDGLHRHYPYKFGFALSGPAELKQPCEIHPVFWGCFDWHSSVHSQWSAVRLLHAGVKRSKLESLLESRWTQSALRAELAFLRQHNGFEAPYGLAWLLMLVAEATQSGSTLAKKNALLPLAAQALDNLQEHFSGLSMPETSGQHSQSAFSMALCLEATEALLEESTLAERARTLREAIRSKGLQWFHNTAREQAHSSFESLPSAYDFLDPQLAMMSLMTKLVAPAEFAQWFGTQYGDALMTGVAPGNEEFNKLDDGKLVHRVGLHFSKSWMYAQLAKGLRSHCAEYSQRCMQRAIEYFEIGTALLPAQTYAGSHWLGSFSLYAEATLSGAQPWAGDSGVSS